MKLRFSLLGATILMVIFGVFALGPTNNALAISASAILVEMTPQNPAPSENVTINLNSYAVNLDSVLINWSVNGKILSSGIGKKSFSLTAPKAGATTTVAALIRLGDGDIETKMVIRPSVMTLLYEATDSYVPPFYRGKALPTAGSGIKVVAMPEAGSTSGRIDPKTMTYSWKINYNNDQSASGYGKNFYTFTNDYLEGSDVVGVVASTTNQSYSSESSIDIGTTDPELFFYRNDGAMGTLWNKSLDNPHVIMGDEIVVGIPYFMSPKDIRNPRLNWNWSINGSPVSIAGIKKNFMPLKAPDDANGTSRLRLEITNQDKIFQTVSSELNIEF